MLKIFYLIEKKWKKILESIETKTTSMVLKELEHVYQKYA